VAVGPGAVIGKNARIRDSVVWPGAIIGANAVIEECVVSGAKPVGGHHRGGVL
jgi:NDP-sugar pyrophosphorylase family protein